MDTTAITWTRLGQSNEFIATLDGGARYHVHNILSDRGCASPLNDCAVLERSDVDALVLAGRAEWRRVFAQDEKNYAAECVKRATEHAAECAAIYAKYSAGFAAGHANYAAECANYAAKRAKRAAECARCAAGFAEDDAKVGAKMSDEQEKT